MPITTRNRFLHFMAFSLLALAMPSAYAMPTYAIDTKLGEANLGNSGDTTERAALAAILGVAASTLVQDLKVNVPAAFDNDLAVANTNLSNSWYLDVAPTTPGWFLLKFGTGGTTATADTFFFQNIADMTKLVWANNQVQGLSGGGGRNSNIDRLSHYTSYDPTAVPAPLVAGLIGLGLVGVGAAGRMRKTS